MGPNLDLRLWRWQRTTALIALPLVILHLVLQYLVFGVDASAFEQVSARVKGGAILTIDILLLSSVGAHAFLGMRSMLQDYARTSAAAAWITRASLFAFVVVLVYGVFALAAFL